MSYLTRIPYWELIQWRDEAFKRFGSTLDLKVSVGVYNECRAVAGDGSVLDVGAGRSRILKKYLKLEDDRYFSMDSDEAGGHQFRTFEDVSEHQRFDLVVMNQVLEHVTLDDAYDMLKSSLEVLKPGGKIIATVPNAAHPTRFFSNVTHITNWNYCDFYSMFRVTGFEIDDIMRANKHRLTLNPIRRWLINAICRDFRIDWCDTLILVAHRQAEEQG